MKTKLLFFVALCMANLTMQAQKYAVLDFEIGSNIDTEEAENITHLFLTNFHPVQYSEIDRQRVNSALVELGFPATGLDHQQLTKLGRTLEASFIVVGSMSEKSGEYSVDVQAIDISTGTTVATTGDTFKKSKCRKKVKSIASHLARKLKKY